MHRRREDEGGEVHPGHSASNQGMKFIILLAGLCLASTASFAASFTQFPSEEGFQQLFRNTVPPVPQQAQENYRGIIRSYTIATEAQASMVQNSIANQSWTDRRVDQVCFNVGRLTYSIQNLMIYAVTRQPIMEDPRLFELATELYQSSACLPAFCSEDLFCSDFLKESSFTRYIKRGDFKGLKSELARVDAILQRLLAVTK